MLYVAYAICYKHRTSVFQDPDLLNQQLNTVDKCVAKVQRSAATRRYLVDLKPAKLAKQDRLDIFEIQSRVSVKFAGFRSS